MRPLLRIVLLAASCSSYSQVPNPGLPDLPKDPRAILSAAQPLYDFSSPDLKPWHLKASYQLYDDSGKPTEQGTFEYWWASPKVHRVTWTRPGMTHSDWYTSDGRHAYQTIGSDLTFFERSLSQALLSPIPDSSALDPAHSRLQRKMLALGDSQLSCIMVIPVSERDAEPQAASRGIFSTYCFSNKVPVIRASYAFGVVDIQSIEFNNIAMVQRRYIARDIAILEGQKKRLTALLEDVNGVAASDPALIPPAGIAIIPAERTELDEKTANGLLIKKEVPVYPQDAKDARVSGKVLLDATIGVDGNVPELHVIEAPWPSLAASAFTAVSHWRYRPYQIRGQPVEVKTIVTVIYSIGY